MSSVQLKTMVKTVLKRNEELLANEVGGEIVMMSIENGKYFGLNKTGSHIWKLLETPMDFEDLCLRLCELYQISLTQCTEDLKPFIEEMLTENIIISQKFQ